MKLTLKKYNSLLKIIYLWLPPIIWGLFIFSFSSVTTPKVSEVHWQDFIIKKFAHLVEYGLLSLLLFRAFIGSGARLKTAFIYTFLISFFYGVTDEFHQSFTPSREPAMRDVIIDGIGSLGVLLGIRDVLPKMPRKFKEFMFKLGIKYHD